ncbi:hypothetical protein KJ966_17640 [bacterium]|nr:hypothetical protein [bacterium]
MKKVMLLSIQLAIGIFLPFIASVVVLVYHFGIRPGIFIFVLTLFFFCLYWYGFLLLKIRDKFRIAATLLESSSANEHTYRGPHQSWDNSFSMLIDEINRLSDTLQKKQNEIIAKSALLKKILDKIPVAILTFDTNHQVTLANPQAGNLFDCLPDSLLNKTAEHLNLNEIIIRKKGVLEHHFPAESGKWRFEVTHFFNTGDENLLLLITNLTQPLIEETLNAWKRLIRVISHEINNSLAPIQSTADTIANLLSQTNISQVDLMQSGLELITERTRHLHGFINEYSRITKLPKPQLKSVVLSDLLDHVQALYQEQQFICSGQLDVTLEIDATMVQQALINLVKNAREAMGKKRGVIEFNGRIQKNRYVLFIKDQGHGIANPENILTPFYTTKQKGSGIGLALCHQIIEAHQGTLAIQNRSGGIGAEVVLTFPIGS